MSEGEEKEQGIKKLMWRNNGWKFSEPGEGKRHTSLESADSPKINPKRPTPGHIIGERQTTNQKSSRERQ